MDSINGESSSTSKNNNQNTNYHRRRHHHHHHFKSREPLQDHQHLQFHHAQGPFSFLNPTRAHFTFHPPASKRGVKLVPREEEEADHEIITSGAGADDDDHNHRITKPPPPPPLTRTQPAQHVRFLWRSRDNRKGRHALQITTPPPGSKRRITVPQHTSHPYQILLGIKRTLTYFPIWDISWLVAMAFTLGSVVWVINGFFSWLPVVAPSTEFPGESKYAGGISAFIGAIVFFEVGSVLLVIEAVNADQVGCFGWAVEEVFEREKKKLEEENDNDSSSLHGGHGQRYRLTASTAHCRHHHQNKRNLVGKPSRKYLGLTSTTSTTSTTSSPSPSPSSWQWLPTLTSLRTHYIHDLGFLAGAAQLFAATVFGISGITALPGINDHLTPQWRLNAAYWIPQVIGGSGFIVSSSLYLLETQRKWYIPAPRVLGWHIAFWNLIGSVGFTLCGALGMVYGSSGAQYQAGLATFWGSWAFLIGSYLQLYESLDKHPVEQVSSMEEYAE
ncbi:hypothetical protein PV10_02853 [Exophiala mesophila]|uniref:Integral membrane protein n=1 Tax=Exophiala mesophila TaxID=212818 RepID=A0A0D1ZKL0_EXOME|nr:uncharacterized protein PV10_02853 [Exophiala mesophila]KIV95172.1 hypothetical protein PV10_02853 [Exophiala mesophila]